MRHLCWLAGLLVLSACGTEASQRTDTFRPELVVLGGATDVRRDASVDGRNELTYQIDVAYPADAAIMRLRAELADGWKPLTEDWLNPGTPSGNVLGWSAFADGTRSPRTIASVWSSAWTDPAGDLVLYSLRYDSAFTRNAAGVTPDNSTLAVNAVFMPADMVGTMREQLGIESPLK
jgi:hypothetical protein